MTEKPVFYPTKKKRAPKKKVPKNSPEPATKPDNNPFPGVRRSITILRPLRF